MGYVYNYNQTAQIAAIVNKVNDIRDLLIYLYADKTHEVMAPGVIEGTWHRFRMNGDMQLESDFLPNLGTGTEEWTGFSLFRDTSVPYLLDIIECLKAQPPVESENEGYESRWDEVVGAARKLRAEADKIRYIPCSPY